MDNGQGVITGHDAATLWEGDPNYEADPANPVNGDHAVHTTGLVRDANGNVTHYVINDTGTGTSGRMVPADQFHQSLDGYDAVMTDAPIRTPTAAREAAPTTEDAPAVPEGTTAPRDAASRGDPASEEGDPASGESAPEDAMPGEEVKPANMPEAKASGEHVQAAGDGDPTVQMGDRSGGLRSGEESNSGQDDQATEQRGTTRRASLKEEIKKAIPAGNRSPKAPRVTSEEVPYNGTDLSKMAVEYRQENGLMDKKVNVAVFEYTQNGVKGYEIGQSEYLGGHSEETAWAKLSAKGIQPGEIERVYTEREPCTLPAHTCATWMQSILPDAKVTHSFEYGDTKASRDAGNAALYQALKNIREGN